MKRIERQFFTGERSLFAARDLELVECTFGDGESPLKESQGVVMKGSSFRWKYPLWYSKNVKVDDCVWFEMARSGIWYTDDIEVKNSVFEAPKNFRRCNRVRVENVKFLNAAEMFWKCEDVYMKTVTARGDYFAMNSSGVEVDGLDLVGNYFLDGAENITVRNSKLLSKDAFWNVKNCTVSDSEIYGEYLGWNSENLTFENCTIESLQGLCYIKNLVMRNCRLLNTTLSFEYCEGIDAEITGKIDSVLNPSSGTITADYIEELIVEPDKVDPTKTRIVCKAK